MSSNTRILIRIGRRTEIAGRDEVSLDSVLGSGGAGLLAQTLAQLPALREQLGAGGEQLDWHLDGAKGSRYRTTVDGTAVALCIEGALATVEYQHAETVFPGDAPARSPIALRQQVNRKVNQLLAVALSQRITQCLKQQSRSKLQASLTVVNTNRLTLRTHAYYT